MAEVHVDEHVRLMEDLPDRDSVRGELGMACSTWFAPPVGSVIESALF